MSPSNSQKEIKYQSLAPDEGEDSSETLLKSHNSHSVNSRLVLIGVPAVVAFVIALVLGWFAGQHFSERKADGLILPPGRIETAWEHNLTFTQRPTPESEAAWNSLIPVGRGFVHHPEIAPFISNIAVFHQLHCLHAIVVSYYTAVEEAEVAKGGQRPDSFLKDTGTRMAEGHIRHCFDYIRQALMCGADTNLEVLDRETRATSGWGQNRQCRDYYEVVEWAEKWANSTETGILTKGTIPEKH